MPEPTPRSELAALVTRWNSKGSTLSVRQYRGSNPAYGPLALVGSLAGGYGRIDATGDAAFLLDTLRYHDEQIETMFEEGNEQ